MGAKFITLYFIWPVGDDFYKKLKFKKKSFHFKLFHVFSAQLTLKGSRNIPGFALIRAVLFQVELN